MSLLIPFSVPLLELWMEALRCRQEKNVVAQTQTLTGVLLLLPCLSGARLFNLLRFRLPVLRYSRR